jgi:acyl-coenzyme A thioesterase PaaI-like protein
MNECGVAKRTENPISLVRSDHECFGCGDLNPIGLHLRFAATTSGVAARFTPTREHQGYDLMVHGGIIASVLDEAMAWATGRSGIWAVTGEISVRFRSPLHVGEETEVIAEVTGSRGRLVSTSAELRRLPSGKVVASATAKMLRATGNRLTVGGGWWSG